MSPGCSSYVGVPYTGSGPGELYLCQDKALAKQMLRYQGITYPRFAVFPTGAACRGGGDLRMPLFVKPLRTDGSVGVDDATSLVHDADGLARRVGAIHDQVHDAALAEEFIDGRELYVGILGNDQPQALPIVEMDFSGLPAGAPHVLGVRAKFDERSAEYRGTRAVVADLPAELRARLQRIALDAYRALRVRDYGRVNLRLGDRGEPYVIEVNASCYLEEHGELALAGKVAGIDYTALVNRIAELARERFAHRVHPVAGPPMPTFSP